ncbi:MAG: hypothetical protein Q9169_008519, partial [Polycauliona sp. 2 TL-2023]
ADNTPSSRALAYITSPAPQPKITESEAAQIYDSLPPLPSCDFLLGSWEGGCFETGHPGCKALQDVGWAGKDFRGVDDVDPIMVFNDQGKRVWSEKWGRASLRQTIFRTIPSVAMIYDNFPIIDHFRAVSDDIVMGAMDAPKQPVMGESIFYFYLKKRQE